VTADRLRQLLAPAIRRVTIRRIHWLLAMAIAALVFTQGALNRVLSLTALVLMVGAMLLLMPLRLQQRLSPLTDEDAQQLLETASGSGSMVMRNRLLADAALLVIVGCAVVWLSPLAGALVGFMAGTQTALYRWTVEAMTDGMLDRLNPLVRDLVATRPSLVAQVCASATE
jgi:hypothetical protein